MNTVLQIWLTGGIFLLTCLLDCEINLKAFSKTLVYGTSHKTGTFSNTTDRTSCFTSLHSSVFYMVSWTHHTSSKYDVRCWNVELWQLESNTINGKLCEKVLRMPRCAANQVAKQELGSHSRRGKGATKKNEVSDVLITHGRTSYDKNLLWTTDTQFHEWELGPRI